MFLKYKMSYCKVQCCRFSGSHITAIHVCGACGEKGHGVIECGESSDLERLEAKEKPNHVDDEDICVVPDCPTYWQHTSECHYCSNCGDRHGEEKCDKIYCQSCDEKHSGECKLDFIIDCPICKVENTVNIKDQRLFGITTECNVCYDKEVEIGLPECKHACLCRQCVRKMEK